MSEEQNNEKKSKMEIAHKVADTIDKTVLKADSLVSNTKNKAGDAGAKVLVGLLIVLALAIYKNPDLGITIIIVFALLFLKPILSVIQKFIKKDDTKQVQSSDKVDDATKKQ